MNLKYKVSLVASAALMLTLLAPKAFAENSEISGNGEGSTNTIQVSSNQRCDVTQQANTNVGAIVDATSNTGGNTANNNTGGTTGIQTGNATSTATVSVTGGSNTATDPCCCKQDPNGGADALISHNGNNSTNKITETSTKSSSTTQNARTRVRALVGAKAKTGKNNASGNTGSGTTVGTGKAESTAGLTVKGGTNTLNP